MDTMSLARRNRLHRSSAARFLASLETSCSLEELSEVDWQSLVKVPHWCLSERAVSNRLQLTAGTVFLAPLIAQWVDGHRIKQARALVGERVFELSMRAGANRATIDMHDTGDSIPELVAGAGASVLVSAIDHPVIRRLLGEQFPMQIKQIDEEVARSLYQLALDVVDATESHESHQTPQQEIQANEKQPVESLENQALDRQDLLAGTKGSQIPTTVAEEA